MAASLNKVFLVGNLTRDPELRYLPSGQAVTTFSVAVNRNYTSNTGERKQETTFVRIVVWARRAEVCNEYLRKGSSVFVEGRLQSRTWEAQDGSKRSAMEVVAMDVQFLGRPAGGAAAKDAEAESVQLPEVPFGDEVAETPSKKGGPIEISKDELSPDEEVPF